MKIVKYTPERRQDFVDLNVWWIEKYFGAVEQADRDEFDHVEDEIAKGGMAIDRGEGEWEIAKLGSAPDRPHKGYGKAVFEACVDWAEQHGAKRIYMLTNSSLSTAIHIYESHGFQRVFLEDYGGYARGDYALEKYV